MLTLLINETKPLAGLFASTTGGIGSVPDISVADEGQAVSVQTFTRTAGVITDSFVAGDVLHIGIGDGVNAPVCYIELSSASPATGTMAINTVGMVALFAATSANQLTLNVGVVRTRGGNTNTIFSAPIVIHRSVIDPDTAVPTPSILGTGVAAALQVAINTALGFVRLDASARLPAVDGSQLTNLPNTGGVTSITGTANEITVTGTTTPTLSLPSALTFTGKTVTGGTFTGGAFNGTVGATTPATVAGTTGTFSGAVSTTGANASIYTDGTNAHIYTFGEGSFIQTRDTFKLDDGTYTTTLSHAPTASRAIALPNAAGTLALTSDITGGTLAGSFTTLTASATTSLLLGTAGSAVGNIGFRNATSGTTTLQPATGALGTGTVTLPLTGTLATLEGSNTYTGTTNTFTLPTTTGTTTTSGIAVAANSLTTGTGIYAASSSLTSGKLMDLQVSGTAAAASQTALNVATAGANGTSGITSKGAVISNTHTGTTSTNVALELTASGGTTNTALNVTAGAIVLQQSPTKYTTITPGALGGLVFTLTTDGSTLDSNYGITVPGKLTIAGNNGYAIAISATGSIITTSSIQGNTIGWINNGNVGFSFGGTTVSTGSSTTVLSVGATTQSTTTTTGAIVTAGGLGVVKNANIGGTLAVTGASTLTGLLTANGGITLGDAQNIALNTTTGTKIGAATTQKLSFWDATPIVQPTTAVASATVAHTGGGTNIKTDDTFDGYTIAQVVKALRNAGLLA
jgi:hypothetical protein